MSLKIETEHLILRQWQLSDMEKLILLAGQDHIEYWMPDWQEYHKHAEGWIKMVLRNYEIDNPMENFIGWAVTLKERGELIGFVGIGGFDEAGEKEISIAYWMDIKYNGYGYMTESAKAVADMAFNRYDYDHIIGAVQPDNHPSRRVLEKTGFKYVKTIEFKDSDQREILPFHYYRMDNPHRIINIRDYPEYYDRGVDYFSSKWGIERKIYEDSISDSILTDSPLPRWYLMLKGNDITGSFGLIENDFMVRKDLMPWLCALYIEKSERRKGLGGKLLRHGRREALGLGFPKVYLCTSHVGYYEKFGWRFFGMEKSEFGGEVRVYMIESGE